MELENLKSKYDFSELSELEDFEKTMSFLFDKHGVKYESFQFTASDELDTLEPDFMDGLIDENDSDEDDSDESDGSDTSDDSDNED